MYQLNSKLKFLIKKIENTKNIQILELGVNKGKSTNFFLEFTNKNNGHLISVDIHDCSNVSQDSNWEFIHSSDDNFELINSKIKLPLDLIYIDSLHEANHVKKVFYNYFKYLKKGGICIVDDISWLPYLKDKKKYNSYIQETNKRIFNKVLEIYDANSDTLDLEFYFEGSGYAILTKIENKKLNPELKLKSDFFNFKKIIKYFYLAKPKR